MTKHELAMIHFTHVSGIKIFSTDAEAIDWILTELKSIMPSYKIVKERQYFPLKERYYISLKGFDGRDYAVGIWMVKQLMKRGWRPFDFTLPLDDEGGIQSGYTATVRLVYEDVETGAPKR